MINTGSIFLGVALFLVVALVLARPFFVAHYRRQGALSEREALEAQKDALLAQIRELDFDHETGKLPDEVHKQRRAELVAEAAAVLQQLDHLKPTAEPDDGKLPTETGEEIEAAVARLRRVRAAPVGDGGQDEIETAVARLRGKPADGNGAASEEERPAAGKGARYCPQCGQPRDAGDKFCAYCGHHFS
ncbi:MAG TPA: zinc ribbon domain-containing protein [Candidatus Sulfomarinibacteraceae bacterium]|nr:zinc ribbon domain-containing protein [Candidatus Sulfomarinibacteraceae bacterium]